MTCSECGYEIPDSDWSCSHCGNPVETDSGSQTGKEITTKGMMLLLALFVFFPILLFVLHIVFPDL